MYLEHFKLAEFPFRLAPDSRFLYWSTGHAAALAGMRFAQACLDGCAVITGEKGTGKTTLLNYLLDQVPTSAVRIDFPPPSLSELGERMRRSPQDTSGGARTLVFDNAHLFGE